jgi:hypothetical protein
MLERIHIYDVLPRQWVFVHTHDGVRAALAALDDGENGLTASLVQSPASHRATHASHTAANGTKDVGVADVQSKDVSRTGH